MTWPDEWLEYQNGAVRDFVRQIEDSGNEPIVMTIVFDRMPGAPLDEAMHIQRISTIGPGETVDQLVKGAWEDVMLRELSGSHPYRVIADRELDEEAQG